MRRIILWDILRLFGHREPKIIEQKAIKDEIIEKSDDVKTGIIEDHYVDSTIDKVAKARQLIDVNPQFISKTVDNFIEGETVK